MGKSCLEHLKKILGPGNLSTNDKVILLLWIVSLLVIRLVLEKVLSVQEAEFQVETVWSLGLLPAILVPFKMGFRASILFAFMFLASGVVMEGAVFVLGNNFDRLFFRSLIILTCVSSVTVIIGIFLERLKSQQETLSSLGQGMALIEERHRLGRELHDTLAQTLPTLKLKLLTAIRELETQRPENGLKILHELADILQQEITNTRCLISDFICDISDDKSFDLIIHECLEKARRYYELDIEVLMPTKEEIDFPVAIKAHLARIVQEAFTNIRKHSQSKKAFFCLNYEAGFLSLEIKDDGCGFDMSNVSQFQYGLLAMRERAKLINAQLEICSKPGIGTSVTVKIPLRLGEVKNDGEEKSIDCR